MPKDEKLPLMVRQLQRAIERDGRTVYAIAKAAGVATGVVYRFQTGERWRISLETVDKLARVLGLKLRPKRPKGQRSG